jgi:hypothetical protein
MLTWLDVSVVPCPMVEKEVTWQIVKDAAKETRSNVMPASPRYMENLTYVADTRHPCQEGEICSPQTLVVPLKDLPPML